MNHKIEGYDFTDYFPFYLIEGVDNVDQRCYIGHLLSEIPANLTHNCEEYLDRGKDCYVYCSSVDAENIPGDRNNSNVGVISCGHLTEHQTRVCVSDNSDNSYSSCPFSHNLDKITCEEDSLQENNVTSISDIVINDNAKVGAFMLSTSMGILSYFWVFL